MSSSQGTTDAVGFHQEYTEINNNIRHYSALRFHVLTVFFAATGGVASVAFGLFGIQARNSQFLSLSAKIAGLLLTALFFQYEWLIVEVLRKNRERGRELEKLLGYKQISMRSRRALTFSHLALRSLYFIFVLFWVLALVVS
jgi:hypothetical protein